MTPFPPPRLFDILTLPGEDLAASALMCRKAVAAPHPVETRGGEDCGKGIRHLGSSGLPPLAWSFSSPGGVRVPAEAACQQGHNGPCPVSLMPASHRARKGAGMGGALLRSLHLAPQEAKKVVWQGTFFLGWRSAGGGGGQVLTFLQGLHTVG